MFQQPARPGVECVRHEKGSGGVEVDEKRARMSSMAMVED